MTREDRKKTFSRYWLRPSEFDADGDLTTEHVAWDIESDEYSNSSPFVHGSLVIGDSSGRVDFWFAATDKESLDRARADWEHMKATVGKFWDEFEERCKSHLEIS